MAARRRGLGPVLSPSISAFEVAPLCVNGKQARGVPSKVALQKDEALHTLEPALHPIVMPTAPVRGSQHCRKALFFFF